MTIAAKESENHQPLPQPSELSVPRWSVITFEDCAASGLTYDEAAKMVEEMKNKTAGLCIVTDEAAQKLYGKKARQIKPNDQSDIADKHFAETL